MDKFSKKGYILKIAIAAVLWVIAYKTVLPLSNIITYNIFSIEADTNIAKALQFFIYDTLKIFLLLFAMIYLIGWIRASISVERVRDFLVGKKSFIGYSLGSTFGAITPFCSCSSIPLFLGFTSARIPLGVTMAFLITSPIINEVAVVILWGLLGWKFTVAYILVGMGAGIAGGFIMDKLKAERWLKDFIKDMPQANIVTAGNNKITWEGRHKFAYSETKDIFRRVWLWIIIGVAVGAALHGYVPQEFVTNNLDNGKWWSVPLAVLIGMPLYTNITGIIPIMESLLLKGLPIGTTLAFCMSTVTISVPEFVMLKQVMKWQLLTLFAVVMMFIFVMIGWFFNFIEPYLF